MTEHEKHVNVEIIKTILEELSDSVRIGLMIRNLVFAKHVTESYKNQMILELLKIYPHIHKFLHNTKEILPEKIKNDTK
jgi:hypothetical protein